MTPAKEELYCVIFNKAVIDGKLKGDTYVLNTVSQTGEIPVLMQLKGEQIIITFESNTKHAIRYESGVELFYRPIKKEDGTVTEDKPIEKRTRKRQNPV